MFVPKDTFHLFSVRFTAEEAFKNEFYWLYYYPGDSHLIEKCCELLKERGYTYTEFYMREMPAKSYTITDMNEKGGRKRITVRINIAIRYVG